MEKFVKDMADASFFSAVLNGDINELVKTASEILELPIMVFDDMGSVLAFWPKKPVDDPDFDSFIVCKNVPNENYLWYAKRMMDQKTSEIKPIVIDKKIEGEKRRIVMPVYVNQTMIGSLGILIADHEITKDIIYITERLSKAVAQILAFRQLKEHQKEHRSNHMLNYLLTAPDKNNQDYKRNAERLGIRYKGPYACMYVRCSEEAYEDVYTSRLQSIIRKYMPTVLQTDLNEGTIFLLGSCNEGYLNSLMKDLKKFLVAYPVHVSSSILFPEMSAVYGYYRQALLTMRIGEAKNPGMFYYRAQDFFPLQAYADFAVHNEIEPYIHQKLQNIMRHDEMHNTDYYSTLWVYLFCFMNVKESAEMLHIHTNTMHYSLDRLAEMFQIDFKDYYELNILTSNFGMIYATREMREEIVSDRYLKFLKE